MTVVSVPGGVGYPYVGDILAGYQTAVVTTAGTALITIPANRVWMGSIAMAVTVSNTGAVTTQGQALCSMTLFSGGTITPNLSPFMACEALCGANVAGGTVGTQGSNTLTVPNLIFTSTASMQLISTVTIAGTSGRIDVTCFGVLIG